ncbi:lipopolysaccharide assembly protein LapA domain-containing protein [Micromonospora sp. CPCC 205714]|uniref:lipopolysaccharide assembly protein LapA domain-containing protein n=1 Tax=Micromonospora sp. CPCC 205714 TaxID=3122402 RepID=UPI002FF3594B
MNGHDGPATSRLTPLRLPVKRSRIGDLWIVAVVFAIVLLLLLIFVLQNGQRAEVTFLGVHVALPLGVALLLAAVVGVLLVALPGTARIVQLRMRARRAAPRAAKPPGPTSRPATGVAQAPPPHQEG